jgi:hypothetical protein
MYKPFQTVLKRSLTVSVCCAQIHTRKTKGWSLRLCVKLLVSDAVKVIASGIKHCILSPGIMSLSITEFPQDILLELAKRLDVADLLSLLSVSQ